MNEVSKLIDRTITDAVLDSNVTTIGDYAFDHCSKLTSITVNATTPPALGSGAFNNTNDCPIIVPVESVDAYKTAWSNYADRIFGEGVAYWKLLGGTCDTNESGYNTGYVINTYEDVNPTSPTYGNTRTETVQDEETCPTQVWELTDSLCETDGSGKNTGYVINTYEDVNPSSSTYGQTRTETVRDKITCPAPVGAGFTKITSLDEATSGKYLIVNTSVNKALNASLIKYTTTSTTGINAKNNVVDVTIENDTITADTNIMNAAADYDADNKTLSWTDSDTGTTYYLYWQGGSGARFAYNGNMQPSTQYPMEAKYYQSFNSFSFANSTKLIAYNTTGPRFYFYNPNGSQQYEENMALFKLN